jgi:hypothetical protein
LPLNYFLFCLSPILLTCRELLNQTYKEGRILLTRDVKLLRYQYIASNQVYRVKSLLKHDQLDEVRACFDISVESLISLHNFSKLAVTSPRTQIHVS